MVYNCLKPLWAANTFHNSEFIIKHSVLLVFVIVFVFVQHLCCPHNSKFIIKHSVLRLDNQST